MIARAPRTSQPQRRSARLEKFRHAASPQLRRTGAGAGAVGRARSARHREPGARRRGAARGLDPRRDAPRSRDEAGERLQRRAFGGEPRRSRTRAQAARSRPATGPHPGSLPARWPRGRRPGRAGDAGPDRPQRGRRCPVGPRELELSDPAGSLRRADQPGRLLPRPHRLEPAVATPHAHADPLRIAAPALQHVLAVSTRQPDRESPGHARCSSDWWR